MAWYVRPAWSAAQVTTPAGAGLVMGIGALLTVAVVFGAVDALYTPAALMIWSAVRVSR